MDLIPTTTAALSEERQDEEVEEEREASEGIERIVITLLREACLSSISIEI